MAGEPLDQLALGQLKKKRRDAERALKKLDQQPEKQAGLQRLLRQIAAAVARREEAARIEKLAQKYKYLRFVERKKTLRKIGQLEKKIKTGGSDSDLADLRARLQETRVNLSYVDFFPVDMKYIALYPKSDADGEAKTAAPDDKDEDNDNQHKSNTRRDAIRERVRTAMRTGEIKKKGFTLYERSVFEEAGATTGAASSDDSDDEDARQHKSKNKDEFFM